MPLICEICTDTMAMVGNPLCRRCHNRFEKFERQRIAQRRARAVAMLKAKPLNERPMLRAVDCPPVIERKQKAYEVSYIDASGIRITLAYDGWGDADTMFREIQIMGARGLRLSGFTTGGEWKVIKENEGVTRH